MTNSEVLKVTSEYNPAGDQPQAIEEIVKSIESNEMEQVFDHLKSIETSRQEMLRKIKSGESIDDQKSDIKEEPAKPAWEEKIEKIEKKNKK